MTSRNEFVPPVVGRHALIDPNDPTTMIRFDALDGWCMTNHNALNPKMRQDHGKFFLDRQRRPIYAWLRRLTELSQ